MKYLSNKSLTVRLFFLFTCLMFSSGAENCIAQVSGPDTTEIQRQVIHSFFEQFGNLPNVDSSGFIWGFGGERLTAGLVQTDPVERIYEFFDRYGSLFQILNAREELRLSQGPRNINSFTSASFKQYVNDVEVENCGYMFHLMPKDSSFYFYSVSVNFNPQARNINTVPSLSLEQAISAALADPQIESDTAYAVGRSKLLLSKIDNSLHLVWKFAVFGGRIPPFTEYWIDANTGNILKTESGVIY